MFSQLADDIMSTLEIGRSTAKQCWQFIYFHYRKSFHIQRNIIILNACEFSVDNTTHTSTSQYRTTIQCVLAIKPCMPNFQCIWCDLWLHWNKCSKRKKEKSVFPCIFIPHKETFSLHIYPVSHSLLVIFKQDPMQIVFVSL